jgi:predicted 3-demethylubiquinone-9 3-methyltransferase (glyoxalase superfamily)
MQKITPFLWFDGDAEEAMTTWVPLFENAEILNRTSVEDGRPGGGESLMMGTIRLAGFEIMLLNGGPDHAITPAISFMVSCESIDQVDRLWEALSPGGEVLMPLDTYPFSERYGWLQDRFGVSWQLMHTGTPQSITPCLLFVGDQFGRAEEAMTLYTSLFDDARIGEVSRDERGAINYGPFTLAGQDFVTMESDEQHEFTFTEGTSLFVSCTSQEEVDHFWNALTANGGQPSVCGWLKDPFGVSWQIVSTALMELMSDPDPEKSQRVTQAMLQMTKIDVAGLENAHAGT